MMRIDRLRVAGFKSFADPVEVEIGDGVTGVVGPNGCGKSNLIEALRWAMGETSARRMRAGGSMDDVIFGGTETRPPRASCEVAVTVGDPQRVAPASFGGAESLRVSRRLDRGEGSSYSVNGRPAKAREVQVLYKDAGVGAGSSALISQGKVSQIIGAKPSERRIVLEEAAGVTGLTSRKRDAESRLAAAEANLERARDAEKELSDQASSLKRQARQARRREEIDALVRQAEAACFLVRWSASEARLEAAAGAHAANEERVKQAMVDAERAAAALAAAQAAADPALKARQEAETALALAGAAVDAARKEAQAVRSALVSARRSAERARTDMDREAAALGSAGEEFRMLRDRLAIARDDHEYDAVLVAEAEAVEEEARTRLDAARAASRAAGEALASARSASEAAARRLEHARRRVSEAGTRLAREKARADAAAGELASLPQPDTGEAAALSALDAAEGAAAAAEEALGPALDAESEAKVAQGSAAAALAAAQSEFRSLRPTADEAGAAAGLVHAGGGMEAAVAAALGEGLSAPVGGGSPRRWRGSGAAPGCPEGLEPLLDRVGAPDELTAALSGVGVAADAGAALAASLRPGQAAVTRDGLLVRWDGYVTDSASSAAESVRRASRRKEIEAALPGLEQAAARAGEDLEAAAAQARACREAVAAARSGLVQARDVLARARQEREGLEARRSSLVSAQTAAEEAARSLEGMLRAERQEEAEAESDLQAVPDAAALAVESEASASAERQEHALWEAARKNLERARAEARGRVVEMESVDRQMKDFDGRVAAGRERVEDLRGRLEEYEAESARLAELEAAAPEVEASALEALEDAAAGAETAREAASRSEEALAGAREAESVRAASLASAREERARLLAELKAAQESSGEVAREVRERLSLEPAALAAASGLEAEAGLPALEACESRLQRLSRERDQIGMVNPLAAEQLKEAEERLGENARAREELREAIRRLRSTIADLDRESRARLTEAFALIDGNFRDLFGRLFGGGHAYLKLSGSDDVLEAGLEIFACPPGKKLQAMSLLSGGEQALAALALVFAAFLVRPAPVCVLDEVDAPLDDSNVGRFCSLVAEMAREGTRFLVVTHHALTMARCDRLYGVTMPERGVSRVHSLDMAEAERIVGA